MPAPPPWNGTRRNFAPVAASTCSTRYSHMLPGTVAMRIVPGLSFAICTISFRVLPLSGPSVGPTQVSASVLR